MSLPPFASVRNSDGSRTSPLAQSLALLFEPSEILYTKVLPHIVQHSSDYTAYKDIIDASIVHIAQLPITEQARFIAGHPRIGEVSGLSALSAAEQAAVATPPSILARLAHLNALYERRYPGLVYITFVAGRTRAQIVPEMEGVLGIEPVQEGKEGEPPVETITPIAVESEAWKRELDRAVVDVGRIAKSRLAKLGVE